MAKKASDYLTKGSDGLPKRTSPPSGPDLKRSIQDLLIRQEQILKSKEVDPDFMKLVVKL